ncbi:MAG: hypothetical protein QM642_01875 [Edaphocola sp.]
MITLKIDLENKAMLQQALGPNKMAMATTRAINVAIRKANTQYRRLIVKEYNLTYADTAGMPIPKQATYAAVEGSISASVAPISLSRFNPTFYDIRAGRVSSITKNKEKGAKHHLVQSSRAENADDILGGVSFRVKKNGAPQRLPFAFMTKGKNKGIEQQIWARGEWTGGSKIQLGKKRLPIMPLKTVSPLGAMTNEAARKQVASSAPADMQKEFERQIALLLKSASR